LTQQHITIWCSWRAGYTKGSATIGKGLNATEGQHIALQHKSGHECRGRFSHQLAGAGVLMPTAIFHYRYAIAYGEGLLGIMGNHHRTNAAFS